MDRSTRTLASVAPGWPARRPAMVRTRGERLLIRKSLRRAHAQRLQFAMQRRALHADESRGAGDVAAEAVDLGDQIVALEDLARLAQGQRNHQVAILVPAHTRAQVGG